MADRSAIEWTDATWNPIAGCSRVSEGCRNCYAEAFAARNLPGFEGLAHFVDRPDGSREARWTGAVTVREGLMDKPLRWRRPRRIFVNSMSDLFHDAVPDAVIDRIFAVMALCPQHTFQILTKRPERMREYLSRDADVLRDRWYRAIPVGTWPVSVAEGYAAIHPDASDEMRTLYGRRSPVYPLPNVWLGTSVSDQPTARSNIHPLLLTPAAVHFLSYEPAIGGLDLTNVGRWVDKLNALTGEWEDDDDDVGSSTSWGRMARLDLVIMGGESGPHARPMHPDWARQVRDQCAAAGVPFFFKQWGEWAPCTIEAEEEDGHLGAAYPVEGCSPDGAHKPDQPALFWQRGEWVEWPLITYLPAKGMRRIGKRAAGRLLDGVQHDGFPEVHHG